MGQLFSRLTEQHYMALGRVTANFSQLEDELHRLIWPFIGPDQRTGQIVTAELSFKGLLALASSLARSRLPDSPLIQELDQALATADGAEQQRNLMLHSIWFGSGQDGVIRMKTTAKRDKGHKVQSEFMDPQRIEIIAEQIATATFGVMQVGVKLSAALATTESR